MLALWGGLYAYLCASKRLMAIALTLILLGVGRYLLFATVLLNGTLPATREDLPYVIAIFTFPVHAFGLGIYQLRRLRRVG